MTFNCLCVGVCVLEREEERVKEREKAGIYVWYLFQTQWSSGVYSSEVVHLGFCLLRWSIIL